MSTARKITPECQPQKPCWLWGQLSQIYPVPVPHWRHSSEVNDSSKHFTSSEFVPTHWHPDQPTAPEPVKEEGISPEKAESMVNQLWATHPTAEEIAKGELLPTETHKMPTEQECLSRAKWLNQHNAPPHYVLMTGWEIAVLKEHSDMLRETRDTAARRIAAQMVRDSGAVQAWKAFAFKAANNADFMKSYPAIRPEYKALDAALDKLKEITQQP